MKNLQALANELATNKLTTLTTSELYTVKGGFFFSRSTTKSYSCSSNTNSYSCGSKKTNNGCNSSSGNGNGRGNGGGEG